LKNLQLLLLISSDDVLQLAQILPFGGSADGTTKNVDGNFLSFLVNQ
jgi:hypothetical protein